MPVFMATTKFNCDTYYQNRQYKIKHNETCIYGVNMQINKKYPDKSYFFVIEMNNQTNKIEGIGYINNLLVNQTCKIYDDHNFNRYIYKGNYHLDISQIPKHLIDAFELILFKGKSNMKRVSGISVITPKIVSHWEQYNYDSLLSELKLLFKNYIEKIKEGT